MIEGNGEVLLDAVIMIILVVAGIEWVYHNTRKW
jgi:hypothetical protein